MNQVVLIGRIANDLNLRYTQGAQLAVLKFGLAVQRMKDNEADFPRITIFGKQAENTERYCRKGSKVAIQGRIQTGSYNDNDGKKIYTTDVIADRIEFLSWNNDDKEEPEAEPAMIDGFEMLDAEVPF